jgi:hypothetical protein
VKGKILSKPARNNGGTGGCLLAFLVVMAFFVAFWWLAGSAGLFQGNLNIAMPDYRTGNARSVNLTANGNKLVDSLYKEGKREGATVKAFITSDKPQTILETYLRQTGYTSRQTTLDTTANFPANSVIYFLEKPPTAGQSQGEGGFIIITGTDTGLVQDQKAGESYIILAEGKL